ncbi:hypothetical protein WUBG_05092, partial [Wuchereria bancrofti]
MPTSSNAEKLRKQIRKAFQMRALTISKDSNNLLVPVRREAMEYAVQILVELQGEEQIRWINKVISVLSKQKETLHNYVFQQADQYFRSVSSSRLLTNVPAVVPQN